MVIPYGTSKYADKIRYISVLFFHKQRGINLLASAKRIQLTRLMRAATDTAFIEFQLQLRRTELLHPISDQFLRQLRKVSDDDIARDPAWRFAPIGVLSHIERDSINLHQTRAFAKAFNLPLIRWRCILVEGEYLQRGVMDELYDNEPNLWCYFVEGAPVLLLETISSVRSLVNGSAGLLDSLTITNEADFIKVKRAYLEGYIDCLVTLDSAPHAVNVVFEDCTNDVA